MKTKASKPRVNGHARGHDAAPALDRGDGRDARGYFVAGAWKGGPGRPPKTVSEYLLDAARQLSAPMEAAKDAVSIARELSPAALLRAFEIMHDPAAEHRDQLAAAEMLLSRGYGLPSQATAVLNLDAGVMSPEQKAQVQAAGFAAFERVRTLLRLGANTAAQGASGQAIDAEPSGG